jgi:hypothetical protein
MLRRLIPLCGVLITGCSNVLSLAPAVSEASAVMDDRLLGEWTEDSSRSPLRVTVTRGTNRSYHVQIVEGRDSTTGIGRLMPMGQRWLLDLSPSGRSEKAIDQHAGIPVHSLVVLEMSNDAIRVATINGDTLRARVRRGAGPALGFAVHPGGDVVLTDATAAIEAGLPHYLSSPGITHEGATYRRPVTHVAPVPRTAPRIESSYRALRAIPGASPSDPVRKGVMYGMIVGAAGGAIIGAIIADPHPRVMFSGRGYGALGGGVIGGLAGATVGGITGGLRQ